MTPPHRGCLLVAAPSLIDPNFFRTVVLLLAHDEGGALGVVLNRPSDTPIDDIVPSWASHASPPRVLFSGGPVQPNAAICVGHHLRIDEDASMRRRRDPEAFAAVDDLDDLGELDRADFEALSRLAAERFDAVAEEDPALGDDDDEVDEDDDLAGYSPLTASIGTVDLHREPEDVAVTFGGLRVFKGYAGWGPGQLEDEIADEAWFVLDGEPGDILTADPAGLWERVLRSQGGWLSVLARHPVDPTLN